MKLVRYTPDLRRVGVGTRTNYGVVRDNECVDLDVLTRLAASIWKVDPENGLRLTLIGEPLPFGPETWSYAQEILARLEPETNVEFRFAIDHVKLRPPVKAKSFRDFYTFEEHVRNARQHRGLEMAPEWYEAPAFYFSNTVSIVGHEAPIAKPAETSQLDYELEIAAVIGEPGRDITVDAADSHIAGFTILNDWSARDIQAREMKVGLGPAKSKDFATSLGPWLVTPDELEGHVLPDRSRGKRYDLAMTARVNDREYSRGNARDMHWTFAEMIAHASRNTSLQAGDVIGSGTVGTGCIAEFPAGTHPWLQPGDVVELAIEGLGVLRNTVVEG